MTRFKANNVQRKGIEPVTLRTLKKPLCKLSSADFKDLKTVHLAEDVLGHGNDDYVKGKWYSMTFLLPACGQLIWRGIFVYLCVWRWVRTVYIMCQISWRCRNCRIEFWDTLACKKNVRRIRNPRMTIVVSSVHNEQTKKEEKVTWPRTLNSSCTLVYAMYACVYTFLQLLDGP